MKDYTAESFAKMTNRELVNNLLLVTLTDEQRADALAEMENRFEYYATLDFIPNGDTAAETYKRTEYAELLELARNSGNVDEIHAAYNKARDTARK